VVPLEMLGRVNPNADATGSCRAESDDGPGPSRSHRTLGSYSSQADHRSSLPAWNLSHFERELQLAQDSGEKKT
jgi:hypothetical protein